ncbi:hypothetical protein [Candidatus Similichlamydia laticola]|uniref:Uncharacterized protein n=1 Tax=Candidatus Similichlamydia laticola TaxID=2170265 RepID=A0A369KDG0_9BACT|nr:hypothetical protein [Candidatus Similichlamydia laticola]RDB31642.1 hypothetical protein HAT2_00253 [Candidatus Similichlamydia laticola]
MIQKSFLKKTVFLSSLGLFWFFCPVLAKTSKPPTLFLKGIEDPELSLHLENQVKKDIKTCQKMALRLGELELQLAQKKNNGSILCITLGTCPRA